MRSILYEREKIFGERTLSLSEPLFGQEVIGVHRNGDFPTYSELRAAVGTRNSGIRSKKAMRYYRFEQDGNGDSGKDSGTEGVKFSPKDTAEIRFSLEDMTPAQIARITTANADTTPVLPKAQPSGITKETGKESNFYDSLLESDNVFKTNAEGKGLRPLVKT